jgi:hypothetical protein
MLVEIFQILWIMMIYQVMYDLEEELLCEKNGSSNE